MKTKKNTPEIIKEFVAVHGDKYDYSCVDYKNTREKVCIICKIHGTFYQLVGTHKLGKGCPKCKGKFLSQSDVIAEFKKVHGDRYDYSSVKYIRGMVAVEIICKKHGSFNQLPRNHLLGNGCPVCKVENNKLTQVEFLKRLRDIHGSRYDYSKVIYKNTYTNITIVCREHGEFEQLAGMHMAGQNCPKCVGNARLSREDFIERCIKVHGNKYSYNLVDYKNTTTKVKILCEIHGEFEQTPSAHKKGQGCPKCALLGRFTPYEEFVVRSNEKHNHKYLYNKTEIVGGKGKVCITCQIHGDFWQRPDQHLFGNGCPDCQPTESKGEVELSEFLGRLTCIERNNRTTVRNGRLPSELDVLCSDVGIAFEFNGLYYHSDRYRDAPNRHKLKTDLCAEKGIRLVHIFEDDWRFRRPIVEKFVRNLLGEQQTKVFARKCNLTTVSSEEAKMFLNENHIQGNAAGEINLALKHEDNTVAVMKLSSNTSKRGTKADGVFELVRYATSCSVVGGSSKLFKHFLKTYKPTEVRSFSDDSMFTGEMYPLLGFVEDGKVPPDYKVVVNGRRCHKAGFKRSELARKYPDKFDPLLTEKENCHKMGLYRVYDAGKTRWIWKHLTTPENMVI